MCLKLITSSKHSDGLRFRTASWADAAFFGFLQFSLWCEWDAKSLGTHRWSTSFDIQTGRGQLLDLIFAWRIVAIRSLNQLALRKSSAEFAPSGIVRISCFNSDDIFVEFLLGFLEHVSLYVIECFKNSVLGDEWYCEDSRVRDLKRFK
jgi:hypothetical protein